MMVEGNLQTKTVAALVVHGGDLAVRVDAQVSVKAASRTQDALIKGTPETGAAEQQGTSSFASMLLAADAGAAGSNAAAENTKVPAVGSAAAPKAVDVQSEGTGAGGLAGRVRPEQSEAGRLASANVQTTGVKADGTKTKAASSKAEGASAHTGSPAVPIAVEALSGGAEVQVAVAPTAEPKASSEPALTVPAQSPLIAVAAVTARSVISNKVDSAKSAELAPAVAVNTQEPARSDFAAATLTDTAGQPSLHPGTQDPAAAPSNPSPFLVASDGQGIAGGHTVMVRDVPAHGGSSVPAVASAEPAVEAHPAALAKAWQVAEPHVLLSTPAALEVGVRTEAHGWLRVRAAVGDEGQVTAAVVAPNATEAHAIAQRLPSLAAYLKTENFAVSGLAVQITHTPLAREDEAARQLAGGSTDRSAEQGQSENSRGSSKGGPALRSGTGALEFSRAGASLPGLTATTTQRLSVRV